MALRLIEMMLLEKDADEVRERLKEHKVLEYRHIRLPHGEILVRILLEAEESESVLDSLEKQCVAEEGNRVVILPVEATLPRDEPESVAAPEKLPERISREELYENIKDAARFSWVYLMMVALSTIVASVGLQDNNVIIIIGAMVMAPLLGPNMGVALGTTLGDLSLLWCSLRTNLAAIGTSVALSVLIGSMVNVDSAVAEASSHMKVGLGNIMVALASGCAGALSFTTGASAMLIGVMVAVALLPPLVTFGLLLGAGQQALSMGALVLFLMNLICVNLAGVTTFLIQGIYPAVLWQKERAVKGAIVAIVLWTLMLALLLGVILLSKGG
jgi:uncharacterized hydrophobic protein (TIGR00341 family)